MKSNKLIYLILVTLTVFTFNLFSQIDTTTHHIFKITEAYYLDTDTTIEIDLDDFFIAMFDQINTDSSVFSIFKDDSASSMIFFGQTLKLNKKIEIFDNKGPAEFYSIDFISTYTKGKSITGNMMIEYIEKSQEKTGNNVFFFQISSSELNLEFQIYAYKLIMDPNKTKQ